MNTRLEVTGGRPPAPQAEAGRIRYHAFTRWTMAGFPVGAPTRVRLAGRNGRVLLMDAKP